MTDEERLRVQNSINLSIALMSIAAAVIAGAVAGFIAIADKLTSGWIAFLLVVVVAIAILSLTVSIIFGGWGISA